MADLNVFRGAAWELTASKYRGTTQEDEAVVTVSAAVTEAAAPDPERVLLVLVNLGTVPIFVAPVNTVSSTRGIALSANGGAVTINADDDSTMVSRGWFAISTQAGQTLYRLSVRRITRLGMADRGIGP